MPRPREFDESSVLESARRQFWETGYAGTSLADLTAATGLGKGSLYGAFGDKHALFMRTLEGYCTDAVADAHDELTGDGRAIDRLTEHLRISARLDVENSPGRGCMMAKAAAELGSIDPAVEELVSTSLARWHGELAACITRARDEGDIAADVDADTAREMVRAAIVSTRVGTDETFAFDERDSARLLAHYRVHVTDFAEVSDADAAAEAAQSLGFPVAVKAVSSRWRGRLDGEGARLDLSGPATVRAAFDELVALTGDRRLHVQRMAPRGVATVIRVRDDPSFGSLIAFGLAGATFDLLGDHAYRAIPLTEADARDLVAAPRSAPLLAGYRGEPAVDTDALVDLLVRVSTLVDDIPEVRELVLDPVLASGSGAVVLSGRVRVGPVPSRRDAGPRRLS